MNWFILGIIQPLQNDLWATLFGETKEPKSSGWLTDLVLAEAHGEAGPR